jgi:2-succinyl-5-enolpyruvyl-6-hydroxy-3-cyclohexene-1-carboxylate synthase
MSTATDTHLLLRALCDEFGRCGMVHACTSPGSRNSPIVISLVGERRIHCWSHIDERCAGFFAVGAAKASGRPVAITCTSGTACANLAPAVIEAFHARVPLIVLTADRPAELRDVGAGQAIDQLKLYGDAVKWFVEVEQPDASPASLRWIRQLACRAYWTALEGRPGPVHLNLPLREPLVLDGPLPDDPLPGRPHGAPWVRSAPGSPGQDGPITIDGPWRGMVRVTDAGRPEPLPARGVIVAGRDEHGFAGLQAATTAAQLRYPLLADPLSAARHGDTAITAYDLLLRDLEFGDRLRPELVIRVGDLPTSKPLRAWLASLGDVPQLALDPEGAWQDPAAVVSEVHRGDPAQTLRTLALLGSMPDESWLADWTDADDAVTRALSGVLDRTPLSEPAVARLLGESLGPDVTLFCAASMPIRDLELYLPTGRRGPTVLSNRGANGIDGTVSSAFGVAATGRPVVLLIGDVALAHDIGGLLSARRLGLELTIVLLNNDGGGIFHFLPISNQTAAFKQHIATPHGLAFEHAAALYGLRYERPQTAADLCAGLRRSVGSGEASIIEIRTDRAENLTLHRRLAETGLDALAGHSGRGVNGSGDVSPPPRPPRLSRRAPAASRRA